MNNIHPSSIFYIDIIDVYQIPNKHKYNIIDLIFHLLYTKTCLSYKHYILHNKNTSIYMIKYEKISQTYDANTIHIWFTLIYWYHLFINKKVSFFNWTPPCLEALGTGTAPREHGATRFCEPESAETPTEIPTEIPSRGFKKVDTDKNELCPLKVWRWFQWTTKSQKHCLILHSGNLTEQWKMDPLKMCFLLKMVIFHCYVSLPEGVYIYILRSWLGESSFQCRSYAFPRKYWEKSSLHSNANSDSYLKKVATKNTHP